MEGRVEGRVKRGWRVGIENQVTARYEGFGLLFLRFSVSSAGMVSFWRHQLGSDWRTVLYHRMPLE